MILKRNFALPQFIKNCIFVPYEKIKLEIILNDTADLY